MRIKYILLFFILGAGPVVQSVSAQEAFDFQDDEQVKNTNVPLSGRISMEGARQLDNPDRWILAGCSLNLIFDHHSSSVGQFFLEGFGRFNLAYRIEDDSKRTKNRYQLEGLFREFFWKDNYERFTVSAGRIIDDKSVMDMLQVFDKNIVINRANYFFADPEEVRLGQNMLKLDFFSENDFYADLMFSPYPAFDRVTDFDHPYSLVKNKILDPQDSKRDVEGRLYAGKTLPKGQVAGYAGRFNNRLPILDARTSSPDRILGIYKPYWSIGGAGTMALEPFLLKAEAVYNFEKPQQSRLQNRPAGYKRYDELEIAIGADYNGGDYGLFTLELSGSAPMEDDEDLAANRRRYYGAVSWSKDFLNDRLKLRNTTCFFESFKNYMSRFQLDYFFSNHVSITAKYTRFDINKRKDEYGYMNDFDRIDFSLNYHFNLE